MTVGEAVVRRILELCEERKISLKNFNFRAIYGAIKQRLSLTKVGEGFFENIFTFLFDNGIIK